MLQVRLRQNKPKLRANKTKNQLKVSDSKTYRWKNDGKSSQNCSRKRLGSVMEAPWLGFSSQKKIFSLILSESQIPGGLNEFALPSFPYL